MPDRCTGPAGGLDTAPIYPFRCNLSRREAVENGLTHDVSVIEGPPGTGKTETVLNLIAYIVRRDGAVGVISHTNAAVDNVRDKRDELGFGHVLANLGARKRKDAFFAGQEARNEQVARFACAAPQAPDLNLLATPDGHLREFPDTERRRAERATRSRIDLRPALPRLTTSTALIGQTTEGPDEAPVREHHLGPRCTTSSTSSPTRISPRRPKFWCATYSRTAPGSPANRRASSVTGHRSTSSSTTA